ncbi:type II-A CRISPR-associated protein Csn2 [Enterococcus faecalis]|uniref:type II-A CRISPR-associated protein Csn2 n=1 Tax=Enterococcus faecalis TaxID=1351 RepID=UPI001CCFFF2D|nr:type II-A CRISPR-associated protein Csn2 [Enterococcus faecalis]
MRVFINACTYLTEDEVQQVVEYISLNNVDVLFLEQRVVQNRFQYILDENFYLSYEKA